MSPLTLIQEAVKKAVPEIMELDFGCEIIHNGIEQTIVHCSQSHPFWFSAITDRSDGKILDFSKADVEILGREIRLADILRTIEHANRMPGVYPGELFAQGHPAKWDLAHDSLSWHATHRHKTIDFLAGLLD